MAVSGTISQTTFDTGKLIENAFRECRIPAQKITPEMGEIALDTLYLYLSSLAARGLQLWTIDNVLIATPQGQAAISMPVGSVDVMMALQRQFTTYSTGTASSVDFGTTNSFAISTVGMNLSAGGTYVLNFETSDDGVSWTTVQTAASATYAAGAQYWFDVDPAVAHRFFRVRPTTGSLSLTSLVLGGNNIEVELGRIAMDDYDNLPNKAFQGRPTQFWLDRQRDVPIMRIWPTADATNALRPLVVRRQRHIMDVGTLSQTIDIPQRWYNAIVLQLAVRVARKCPEIDLSIIPSLKMDAEEALATVTMAERDNSPIRFTPRIGMYTR